ncbi:MAG: hypothetical protein ACSLFQ_21065 [Thermoanaerobaculia bacterium]
MAGGSASFRTPSKGRTPTTIHRRSRSSSDTSAPIRTIRGRTSPDRRSSPVSRDIIAHETTHALVDRLRELFADATNHDVPAFHEGFSDIVAIFQHFSFREVLADSIQKTQANLRSQTSLVQLAAQFGYATGSGRALRDAIDSETGGKPDPSQMATLFEPHDRGSILVAAVFDAFFKVYQRRIRDLVRIATGGSGVLPEGDLHPDLMNRIAREASKTAQNVLTMCIRAFEYLPPVDITFGDFLRALVTADYEMVPEDDVGLRGSMIESFRIRGIYPEDAQSLAEGSLLWRPPDRPLEVPFALFERHMVDDARAFERMEKVTRTGKRAKENAKKAILLVQWARANGSALRLDPRYPIQLLGFHTVFRVAPNGELVVELVAQFAQSDKASASDAAFGGIPFRGGTTVIAGSDGIVRYVISKPMSTKRRANQKSYVEELDQTDAALAWCDDNYEARRMKARTSFAAMHRGLR